MTVTEYPFLWSGLAWRLRVAPGTQITLLFDTEREPWAVLRERDPPNSYDGVNWAPERAAVWVLVAAPLPESRHDPSPELRQVMSDVLLGRYKPPRILIRRYCA